MKETKNPSPFKILRTAKKKKASNVRALFLFSPNGGPCKSRLIQDR